MVLVNATGTIATVINGMTTNLTGSLFLTLLLIMLILFAICLTFHIPIEFSAIILFPVMIGILAEVGEFWSVGGVFAIYLGILLGKNFFFH